MRREVFGKASIASGSWRGAGVHSVIPRRGAPSWSSDPNLAPRVASDDRAGTFRSRLAPRVASDDPPEGCAFASRSWIPCTDEEAGQSGEFKEVTPGHWVEVHPATVENYKDYL